MTVREVVKLLKKDGWYQVDTKGSHMQFKHPIKKVRLQLLIIKEIFLLRH